MSKVEHCDRCGMEADRLYEREFENDYGETVKMNLCWDCDHEVCNGDDPFADPYDILMDRAERNYECDPLWYDPP